MAEFAPPLSPMTPYPTLTRQGVRFAKKPQPFCSLYSKKLSGFLHANLTADFFLTDFANAKSFL